MKKKLLFLLAVFALLFALCLSVGAIKADRPYKESKTIKIIDHVVYQYRSHPNHKPKKYYAVIDYFDTDEAANDPKIAKTVKIVDQIGKIPVTDIAVWYYDEMAYDGFASGRCGSERTMEIELPQSIRYLNSYAFDGFTSLRTVTLPDGITSIPRGAFQDCHRLREVIMHNEPTEIGHFAFQRCYQLKKFNFGDGLKWIGEYAFSASGLRSISLHASTYLWYGAFANCSNLTKVKFRTDNKEQILSLDDGVFSGSALMTVVFSKNIKDIDIGCSVFGNCRNLQTLKNISRLRAIGERAFENCVSLREFTLPAGIKYVHPYAFLSCVNLKTLWLNSKNANLLQDCCEQTLTVSNADGNFIDFLRNDCMIYVRNEAMLHMVQEEGLHKKAEIPAA